MLKKKSFGKSKKTLLFLLSEKFGFFCLNLGIFFSGLILRTIGQIFVQRSIPIMKIFWFQSTLLWKIGRSNLPKESMVCENTWSAKNPPLCSWIKMFARVPPWMLMFVVACHSINFYGSILVPVQVLVIMNMQLRTPEKICLSRKK